MPMKTIPNLKISIPKPCHEDWSKFTPDEKGAFCKVCSKSVHDFTKKSAEEISIILIDEMSAGKKVCGRFNEDQLTPVSQVIPSLSPYALNFKRVKRFAMALFLVFGGFLFNSTKSTAQKLMGKVAYTPRPETVKGEVSPRYVEPLDTVESDTNFVVQPLKVTKCNITNMPKGDVIVEPLELLQVMGGVKATSIIEEEPIVGQVALIGDTVITQEPVVNEETLIMGLIAMPEDTSASLPISEIEGDSIVANEIAVPESTFVETMEPVENKALPFGEDLSRMLQCYPNPSTGLINIKYSVRENSPTSLVLYDMQGNVVKTLLEPQKMYAADYNTPFDISELPDGIYFCTIQSGHARSTQKVILSR